MGGSWAYAILVVSLFAPLAAASDPFQDPACVDRVCVGPGTCVPWTACVPPPCQPVTSCSGDLTLGSAGCATNATVEGRTCQASVGVLVEDRRALFAPVIEDATETRVGVGASFSNGSVQAHRLSNTWISPAAYAELAVLGLDAGRFTAGAYHSEIFQEDRVWTHYGAYVHHEGGPLFGAALNAAVWFLDGLPEGCVVNTPSAAVRTVECPPLHVYLP